MRTLVLLVAALAVLPGCGVSKKVKAVKKALTPEDVVEKLAAGEMPAIVPIVFAVLNATQDFAVVHQDGSCVVAEVRKIPGLGISLPGGKDSRYYFRVDLQNVGTTAGSVKMVFTFFKSAVGAFHKVSSPDTLIGKYANTLFTHIIGALLKSGVVFK